MMFKNRNRPRDTESILIVAKWEGDGRLGKKGEVMKRYKLVVTK